MGKGKGKGYRRGEGERGEGKERKGRWGRNRDLGMRRALGMEVLGGTRVKGKGGL